MKKSVKILSLLLALVMAFMALAACKTAEPAATAAPTAAPAATAEPTAAPTPEPTPEPQRIICLAPSMVEVVYALGLGDSIVGWSQYTDYPPEVADRKGWIPYGDYAFVSNEDEMAKDVAVVSGYTDYNKELVEKLEPTLVLAEGSLQTTMFDELKADGYNVLHFMPASLEDVYAMMLSVGEAAGVKAYAEELVAGYKAELAEIEAITSTLPKVKVYFEIAHRMTYGDYSYGPYTNASGSPFDDMIRIAGGENIFADLQGDYVQVEYEDIVAKNPDVILSPMWPNAFDYEVTTLYEIMTRPGFADTNAVKWSRVHFYDSSLMKRFGPRTVTAIKKLAYLLHPYYFENPENSVSPWELGKIDALYPLPEMLH